jgi:hypothetical protein
MCSLATSRQWGREGAGEGGRGGGWAGGGGGGGGGEGRDPSDEIASGRLVSLSGI